MEHQQIEEKQFDVALSFAGEDREYVEKVANVLAKMNIRVFYDKHETITLWGKDLFTYLQDIYKNKAKYTIIFCSNHYAKKLWTNHERQAAQTRAFESNKEYILPARFDDTQIPGILSTTGYVDLNQYSPEDFAELIKKKVGPINRPNFFPQDPDLLYQELKANGVKSKKKALLKAIKFFDSMKLMTVDERNLLATVVLYSCPHGRPTEIHQALDYLERVINLKSEEIKQKFSRLSCLYFLTTIKPSHNPSDIIPPGVISNQTEIITIKFMPVIDDQIINATDVIYAIFDIIFERCCKDCCWTAISGVDFSPISSLEGFDEN